MMNDMTVMMNEYDVIGINQCLRLPKAELNTKNSTKRRRRLVEFLMFNSVYWKKSAPSNGVNRVSGKTSTLNHEVASYIIFSNYRVIKSTE